MLNAHYVELAEFCYYLIKLYIDFFFFSNTEWKSSLQILSSTLTSSVKIYIRLPSQSVIFKTQCETSIKLKKENKSWYYSNVESFQVTHLSMESGLYMQMHLNILRYTEGHLRNKGTMQKEMGLKLAADTFAWWLETSSIQGISFCLYL